MQTDEPKLIVSVEQPEWARGGSLWVNLEIRNPGNADIRGTVALKLIKSKKQSNWDDLWAPLLLKDTEVTAARGPMPSLVKAGQGLKLKVDVQQLKWGHSIQGAWPDQELFSLGAAGDYSLHFRIQIKNGSTVTTLKSNEVKVSLH